MTRVGTALIAMLLVMSVVAGISVVFKQPSGSVPVILPSAPQGNGSQRGPGPFPGEIVPLDLVLTQLKKNGLTLYLPTKMADGLRLTAVWAKIVDGEISFPLIVVYSNTGDTAIATAELAIEIAGNSGISWYVRDNSTDRFDKVGEWKAFISSRVPIGHEEYYFKYQTEFAYCVDLQIGTLDYLFRFSPVLTAEEAMDISASMKPVALQNA